MIEAIIFDFDGTLVDSRENLLGFYEELFGLFGVRQPEWREPSIEKAVQGRSIPDVLECYVADERVRDLMWQHVCNLDYVEVTVGLDLEPFARECVADLSPDYPLAVATNRTHDMDEVIRHFELDGHLKTVLTAGQVERPKPSPDLLLEAAALLRVQPARVLYVGDTPLDHEAAVRAGMPFLLYDRLQTTALHSSGYAPRLTDFRHLRPMLRRYKDRWPGTPARRPL
jgi:beta-phosphoglucomutase-like phosphatase (HAD superfamily)